ncbi:ArdC family protein [Ferrovum myxofaciens]|uniref:ArdC family protein n=1 Tax=Ferrovum myxofaciens TaxID=416213 RepID=UPI00068AED07|nr:zincin-like metallopeptidase domain-containing protein [Ferrovum myxofaciens]
MTEQTQPQTETQTQTQGKRDLRQEITDRFVAALEQNKIPWEKPWESIGHNGLPKNLVSDRAYGGGNRLILMFEQMERGYTDSRFATFKQIGDMGGKVEKGEKGTAIELWKIQEFWERPDVKITLAGKPVKVLDEGRGVVNIAGAADKKPYGQVKPGDLVVQHQGKSMSWAIAHEELVRAVAKTYVVFNVEQCSGLKLDPMPEIPRLPVDERGEHLMQVMAKDGVGFKQHAEAFYSPSKDEIYLPARDAFKTPEGYYGTALHEIGHATGAEQRLKRDGITGAHKFGSEGYAKEELRAELFSTFMAAQTGIPHDEEQHKAYVQSWAKVLKEDKNEIFRAAAEAGKAVDYVLDKERELQAEKQQTAEHQAAPNDRPASVSTENQALAERVEDEPKPAPDLPDGDKASGKVAQRKSRRSTGDAEVSR